MNGITAAHSLPLLPTKLYPPDLGDRPQLLRNALVDRLFEQRDKRLLIISAPAGFGKSTVLCQFGERLSEAGCKLAWLSCDEADSELLRLVQYIVAAIARVCPGFGTQTAELLHEEVSWSMEAIVDAFLADLNRLAEPLYIALDDFHRAHHPGLKESTRYLLERLPKHIHLLVSTRFKPQEHASGPGIFWLDAGDLRLTFAECEEYLRQVRGLELDDDEVTQLFERTEGWITALHLAVLALERCPDRRAFLARLSGTERNIADYLAEDVLAYLDEPLQRFLEQTSLLDEFNAKLCDAITGRDDSASVLRLLQRDQLFLMALDEQGQWFRYHHLFAEFLQERQHKRGGRGRLLHTAALWCESHQQPDRAIRYALRGRDYAFAAEMLERQGARLIAGNRVYGILAMLKGVPVDVIRDHVVFQIFYAWQLAFEQRFAEAEALLEELTTRLMQGRGKSMHFGLAELLAASQVLKALVLLYQDKLEACLKIARQWLAMVPDNQPVFRASLSCVQAGAFALLGEFGEAHKSIASARDNLKQADSEYLNIVASLIEALICKESGELVQGSQIAEAASERVTQVFGARSRVGGPLVLTYADLLYEQNRHSEVMSELPLATTWRDVATPLELISRGQLVMAKARFYSGEGEAALKQLDDWLEALHGPGYERVYAHAMSCKVQFLLWLRRPNEAERSYLQLERHLLSLPEHRYPDVPVVQALALARLALSERRAEKAQAALEACLTKQTAAHQRERRLRVALLLSVAYWRKGNAEKGFALLAQTLQEGWQLGYRRLFIDEALWVLPMLHAWNEALPEQARAWDVLTKSLAEQCLKLAIDPQSFEENQDISHREREILRFVAAGLSNRDIAQAVHLSEATIKWHLHNLFAKLGVRSRTQAVLKGKSLGLLSEA